MSTTEDTPQRWTPDAQLVPALLAGAPKALSALSATDRCWAVAGLTEAGLTGQLIADLLKCSRRKVCDIQAETATQAFRHLHHEARTWEQENQLAASNLRAMRLELETVGADRDRLREKLDHMIDAQIAGTELCRRCKTPMEDWNVYIEGNRRRCRNCLAIKQRAYRARCKQESGGDLTGAAPVVDLLTGDSSEPGEGLRASDDVDLIDRDVPVVDLSEPEMVHLIR